MNQNIQTTIEIKENGKLTQEYKRTILKQHMKHVAAVGADLATWLLIDPLKAVGREFTHQMKLELVDMAYGSHLHAQYKAGKRTQAILSAKRSYGL